MQQHVHVIARDSQRTRDVLPGLLFQKPQRDDSTLRIAKPGHTHKPIVERVVAQSAGLLKLIMVDTDTSADLASHYAIRSIPTLLCFADGELAGCQSGSMLEPHLRTVLRNLGLPA